MNNMHKVNISILSWLVLIVVIFVLSLGGCSKAYYGAMEKIGIHKRDILVDRVEDARDAQSEAQEQFKSALEQFGSVIKIENTDLKKAYDKLNAEYEDSEKAAEKVSERIDKVESVAEALFDEWEEELNLYKSADLRRLSKQKLQTTKARYRKMITSMHRAEKSMTPVLRTFRDNVLFLKHNLNAQAIGSLRTEFSTLKGKIDGLIKNMNEAIQTSNKFIADIKQ
jgi:DNA repair exonuclease SbcCD ATPase subunit